jgi:hypothetical protein
MSSGDLKSGESVADSQDSPTESFVLKHRLMIFVVVETMYLR